MSSSEQRAGSAHYYGPKLVKLVTNGYKAMESNLASAISRGQVPRGSFLKEVLHKLPTVPPLLNHAQYVEFVELLRRESNLREVTPEDVLGALWVIVENDCEESRLVPAISVDSSTGEVVVVLK